MTPSHYWTFLKLTASGQTQTIQNPTAQTFYQTNPDPDRFFTHPDPIARFCLRCFISHQITFAVRSLAQCFGKDKGFTDRDLLPLVLDDDGKPDPSPYRPVSFQILDTFDPQISSLTSWTIRQVRQHPEIKQFLLEHGIYLITPWALLNDTKPNRLLKLLRQTNRTELEITQFCELLIAYRAIYLPDRLKSRTRKTCPPPTSEQLTRIALLVNPALSPKNVRIPIQTLTQLQTLAQLIREDRLGKKIGIQAQKTIDDSNFQFPLESEIISEDQTTDRDTFLNQYRNSFTTVLKTSIIRVIHDRTIATPKKAQQFLTSLQAYYCEQIAMGDIAQRIGVRGQDVVSRLMRLKELRSDIRCHMLSELKATVLSQATHWRTPEELQQADRALDHALDEQLETLMQEESQRDKTPQGLKKESRLSIALCEHLDCLLATRSP